MKFLYLVLTVVLSPMLTAMDNNFSGTLFATNDTLNPNHEEITVENYSSYCIPLVIPKRQSDKLLIKSRYTGETYYQVAYDTQSSEYTPLSLDDDTIMYNERHTSTAVFLFNKHLNSYAYVKVTLNGKNITLPLSNDEKVYALIKRNGNEYLKEFCDTDHTDLEKSLLNYEPTKTLLNYVASNDNSELLENINLVQGYDNYGTHMAFQDLGTLKNIIVSMINKKIDRLKEKKN